MARKSLNLSMEEKAERKRLSNLKYYQSKGHEKYIGSYKSKKVSQPLVSIKENPKNLQITIDSNNVNMVEIRDFIMKFQEIKTL